MRSSPRLWSSILSLAILLLLVLAMPGKPVFAADNQVVLIFGGDVEWALNARPPTVRYRVANPTPYGQIVYGRRDVRDQVTGDWPPIPYTDQGESGTYLKSLGLKGPSDASTGESLSYPLLEREEYTKDYSSDDTLLNYPLQRLAPIFRASDLVMVNCEGALSDHGRQVGLNRTPERFAISMREAGIGLVNRGALASSRSRCKRCAVARDSEAQYRSRGGDEADDGQVAARRNQWRNGRRPRRLLRYRHPPHP